MKQFPMLVKEIKELCYTYKILLLPLIFSAIVIMQPLSIKILPDLLNSQANIPSGVNIEILNINSIHVIGGFLSKFVQLAPIIVILIMMGTITGERTRGITAMVLVKPIGYAKYYFTKFFVYSILVIISFYLSVLAGAYYTEIIFGKIDWTNLMFGSTVYLPNLLLLTASIMFFSSFLKSQLAVSASAFVFYMILNLNFPEKYLGKFIYSISPCELLNSSTNILMGFKDIHFLKPVLGVSILTLVLLIGGWFIFKKQEI